VRVSLRYKILLFAASVVLLLILASFSVVNLWATRQVHNVIRKELKTTQLVFEEFQTIRYATLLSLCRVLGKEFALRSAVATYDPETVFSAALTFQDRMKSDLLIITDEEGRSLARTDFPSKEVGGASFTAAVQAALRNQETTTTWFVEGRLYQVATVPLKTGLDLLGTLSLGFAIDDRVAGELKRMTQSEVTFLTGGTIVASTWPETEREEMITPISGIVPGVRGITVEGTLIGLPTAKEVTLKDGTKTNVVSVELEDMTGTIRLSAWRNHGEIISRLTPGTRVKLRNLATRIGLRGKIEISTSPYTQVEILSKPT